jgi:hypothetical protein
MSKPHLGELAIPLLFAVLAYAQQGSVPAPAGKPFTVEQLEQTLKEIHGQPDAEAAKQLSGLALTERLNSAKLIAWKAGLPGPKAQQALVALGDASAFLAPPAAEIPADAPPDLATQRRMMTQTVDYLGKTLPKLPDFYATRVTAYYEEKPHHSGKTVTDISGSHPLHLVDTSSATVLYRDGHEVVHEEGEKGKKAKAKPERLTIRGTFGPVLSLAIEDAANGQLTWSRWEQGTDGPVGVFRFAVPSKDSHYVVDDGSTLFGVLPDELQPRTAYHGEVTVDPAAGTILRLVMKADLDPGSSLLRADVMVEYGPVEIGGRTYFCPVRSVSISSYLSSRRIALDGKQTFFGSTMMKLNDAAFGGYHMFRSEVRMVSGSDHPPEGK